MKCFEFCVIVYGYTSCVRKNKMQSIPKRTLKKLER